MAGEFGTGIFPKGQFFSFSGGWVWGGGRYHEKGANKQQGKYLTFP